MALPDWQTFYNKVFDALAVDGTVTGIDLADFINTIYSDFDTDHLCIFEISKNFPTNYRFKMSALAGAPPLDCIYCPASQKIMTVSGAVLNDR